MRRKTYQTLAREATNAAKTRGHDLGVWTWGGMWTPGRGVAGRVTGTAKCLACQAVATIDSRPEPDGVDMSGTALDGACQKGTG